MADESLTKSNVSVKVYYIENQKTKEIRKFSVSYDLVGNFEYLAGKIRQIFPDLNQKDIEVFWKDEEEDLLTISSDEELDQALRSFTPIQTVKLFVTARPKSGREEQQSIDAEEKIEHPGITCDGCDHSVKGVRYKCTECFDFDLCETCQKKGIHPSAHEMITIKKPRTHASEFFIGPIGGMSGPRGGMFGPRGGIFGPRGGMFGSRGGMSCPRGGRMSCPRGGRMSCPRGGRMSGSRGGMSGPRGGMSSPRGGIFGPRPAPYGPRGERGGYFGPRGFAFMGPFGFGYHPFGSDYQNFGFCNAENFKECNKDQIEELVRNLAVSFGLDPEVAVSSLESYFHDNSQENSKDKEEPSTNQPDAENSQESKDFDEFIRHFSQTLGLDAQDVAQAAHMFFPSNETNQQGDEGETGNVEFQTESIGQKKKAEPMQDEPTPMQDESTPMQDESTPTTLDDTPSNEHEITNPTEIQSEEPRKPDEFVYVDEKEDKLSDDEKYNRRLGKALKQMEAMGFDNEGGWLTQLLKSKDLSIGRVLDALNQAN